MFSQHKNLNCVEVGVQKGIHAQMMLERLDVKSLLLVDIFSDKVWPNKTENEQLVRDKFRNDPRVTVHKGLSVDYKSTSKFDFVYIDAQHTRPAIDNDINHWWPMIKPGGFLCGHDYGTNKKFYIEVEDAVNAFVKRNNLTLVTTPDGWMREWCVPKI